MSTTRKVTVVSTKNNKVKFYETAATTWGELNAEINNDFDLSNLKATENVNKATLEHVNAVLPEGEFRVFLRPVKTKSGHDFDNMKFGELRATFKDDEEVKKFLTGKVSASGRNWTQLKTDELRDFLKEYHSKAQPKSQVVTDDVVEENVAEEVTKEEFIGGQKELTTPEKFETAMQLLKEVVQEVNDSDMDDDDIDEIEYNVINEFVNIYEDDITKTLKNYFGETAEQKAAREAKEAEDREIADALREASEFGQGFTN